MKASGPYVAFSPLTRSDFDRLDPKLSVGYRIDDTRIFDNLLAAIDAAEEKAKRLSAD